MVYLNKNLRRFSFATTARKAVAQLPTLKSIVI